MKDTFDFRCSCGELYHAEQAHVGCRIICRKCGRILEVDEAHESKAEIVQSATRDSEAKKQGAPTVSSSNGKVTKSGSWLRAALVAFTCMVLLLAVVWVFKGLKPSSKVNTVQQGTSNQDAASRGIGAVEESDRHERRQSTVESSEDAANSANTDSLVQEFEQFRRKSVAKKKHRVVRPAPPPEFKAEYLGTNDDPVISITNDSDREVTLRMGLKQVMLAPKSTVSISRPAGIEEFEASAPNTVSLQGKKHWEIGYKYSWTFWIERSYVP